MRGMGLRLPGRLSAGGVQGGSKRGSDKGEPRQQHVALAGAGLGPCSLTSRDGKPCMYVPLAPESRTGLVGDGRVPPPKHAHVPLAKSQPTQCISICLHVPRVCLAGGKKKQGQCM